MTAIALCGALLLSAGQALATDKGGSSGSSAGSEATATAGAVAGASASATQVTQTLNANSLKQAQDQSQGQVNGDNDVSVNNDNSSNDKNWWSPALGGIPLASGSNAEMAPSSYSGGVTTPFGGLLFGWSEQQLAPSAIYTLADLGEKASRKWQETATPNDKVMAEHIRNGLCTYYRAFADRENLCDQ